ncbi:MAG TPA: hypothetical protein VIX41_02130 [Acidimicrobiales bacterium]
MSKPKDPVLAVLRYFESADLPLALQALALAQAIVKRRHPPSKARPTRTPTKKPEPAATALVS